MPAARSCRIPAPQQPARRRYCPACQQGRVLYTGEFGERTGHGYAEHLVAATKPGDSVTHLLDNSGEVTTLHKHLWPAKAHPHQAHEVGTTGHEVPHPGVDARRPDTHQDVALRSE